MRNKKVHWLTFGAAMIGMGMSMPSCPGQQAMQQQIDTLQTTQTELQKKVQSAEKQLKDQSAANDQLKLILDSINGAIQAQRGALEQLTFEVKKLQARPAPATPKAPVGKSKTGKKKGH